MPPTPVRSPNSRKYSQPEPANVDPNPDTNPGVLDGQEAPRASPDAENSKEKFEEEKIVGKKGKTVAAPATSKLKVNGPPLGSSSLSDLSDHWHLQQNLHLPKKISTSKDAEGYGSEGDDAEDADSEEIATALSRAPPVNSSYLPLPWKSRLWYACLCTYLRTPDPPVSSSGTCRIASILEHRHLLKDPF